MKKIISILTLALILTSVWCQAQEKTAPAFIKKSEALTKATGWKPNKSTNLIVANDNVISDQTVSMSDSASFGASPQNLIWLRTASMRYSGRKFYVFYYHYLGGAYQHPDTKIGWDSYTATRFVIIDSAQYGEFKKWLLQKRGGVISGKSKISDELRGPYDESALLRSIASAMENKGALLPYCFTAKAQAIDGRDVARFRLPEPCSYNKDFATDYFECGFEDFKGLLID